MFFNQKQVGTFVENGAQGYEKTPKNEHRQQYKLAQANWPGQADQC